MVCFEREAVVGGYKMTDQVVVIQLPQLSLFSIFQPDLGPLVWYAFFKVHLQLPI